MHQKNVKFVIIVFLKILDLNLKNMFVINVMIYLKDIAILNAKGNTYRCILMVLVKMKV